MREFNRVFAAHIALRTVREFLDTQLERDPECELKIVLVLFEIELEVLYNELLRTYFPPALEEA